jgi:hypothetical protein
MQRHILEAPQEHILGSSTGGYTGLSDTIAEWFRHAFTGPGGSVGSDYSRFRPIVTHGKVVGVQSINVMTFEDADGKLATVLLGPETVFTDARGERHKVVADELINLRGSSIALQTKPGFIVYATGVTADRPDTLASRNTVAASYWSAGRIAEAIKLYETTLKLRESKLGPDHPDTLTTRDDLASSYWSAGRTAEAIKLYEATLKLRESKLGPNHSDTLTSRHNLAISYLSAPRRTAEAIKLHEGRGRSWQPVAWNAKLGLADLPDEVFARP